MKCAVLVVLIGALLTGPCQAQRIPPPPQGFLNNQNNQNNPNQQQFQPQPPQNASGGPTNIPSMQVIQQQQKTDELANVKDESIKRVLLELSTLQTPSQMSETMARVAGLVGPLFVANFDGRKDQITAQSRDASTFPQRLLSAVTDIQGEEVKALVLQKQLDSLHASDFAFLPLAIQYGLQEDVLRNLSGTKLASLVKVNPGDTVVATKVTGALMDKPDQQIEFLQSLGTKLLPGVQRIIMRNLLNWWGDPHAWKDRELSLLISAGNPLLAFMPQSELQRLDDELADRFVTQLGQTQDIARGWWRKPMSLKKAWFEVAKGARYFGAVHEWSFRRMQKLSFLLEGATPEDLELIPPVPEIKGLVIGNHYTELQARVVFDAFYHTPPLSQEDLQEFQFHVLDLIPSQLQRFDFADSFGTLDEMLSILDRQSEPSYPTVLQISYFMWPIVNSSNSVMNIAPPSTWQKRELSQIGKMFFLLPKSVMSQVKQDLINWDSNILSSIRSNHLSQFQIWRLSSQILPSVDERLKPDYIFMIPSPFQKGIPTQNISQALLGSTTVRPEILRALIEETSGMLISQKAVILQRIQNRMAESIIIRMMIGTSNPSEMFDLISPKILSKNMPSIIKTIIEMPETGRFGLTSIQTKLLPRILLSLWLKWVRENSQVARWTAEDLLGRSSIGGTNELNFAILGLSCRDIDIVDPWDILSVIMHYRHELYALRRFDPALTFNVNLRSCVLQKLIVYLKQKRFLDEDQTDGHVLAGIDDGEIDAIGGEILSIVPQQVLEQVNIAIRQSIIKEIGKLQMQALFSLVPLENLHWYGTTLFRDIEISASQGSIDEQTFRRRRQTEPVLLRGNATTMDLIVPVNTTGVTPPVTRAAASDNTGSDTGTSPVPGTGDASSQKREIDIESLNSMGNLLCYANNLFDSVWPRSLLKDVLEGKTSVGEKTCCLSKAHREKWFETIKAVYGSDSSSWNEFDLTAIGDLLIVLPEQDLVKISTDSLGKASTPIQRQSAYSDKISVPGQIKRVQFVTACSEALGTEGAEFMGAYKRLMKRIFQASQWMVNTVKTTQELIRDGVGRTGRIPRWAEHTLVKRQVPLSVSGREISFAGASAATQATPTAAQAQTQIFSPAPVGFSPQFVNAPVQTFAYTPQGFVQTSFPSQGMSPTTYIYAPQPGTGFQQPMYTAIPQQQPVFIQAVPPQSVLDPGVATGAAAGTSAGSGSASAAAGAGSAGGGSFGGSFAQTNANTGSGNANGFASGGSFSQAGGADPSQTGGLGQTDPNSGTFVARGAGNQPQQGVAPGQPTPQQTSSNPAITGQQPLPNPSMTGQQQQNQQPNPNAPNQSQQPGQQQSNMPAQQQQPTPAQPGQATPNVPGQPQPNPNAPGPAGQGGNLPGQQQNPPTTGQQQQAGNIPGQPSSAVAPGQQQPTGSLPGQGQQASPNQPQTGVVPGSQQQLQTRSLPGQPQQQQQQIGAVAGQPQVPPGNAPPQQVGAAGGIQQLPQPGSPQQLQQPGTAPQLQPGTPTQMQQPGNPQQMQQPGNPQQMQQPGNPQQMQPQPGNPQQQTPPSQTGATGNFPGGRAGGGGDIVDTSQQGPLDQFGRGRERSLGFNGPLQDETHNSEITCHGVKAAGAAAIGLAIEDLSKLSQVDLFDCVEALGRIEWDDETKSHIVTLLKQKLEFNQDSINALTLIEMGDLVTAFSADGGPTPTTTGFGANSSSPSNVTVHSDVSMIDLTLPSSLDVLSILGQQVTDPSLLKALAEKFNQDNRIFPGFSEGIARPENLRIVVMSLGNIICGLNDKIVNSIFETDASLFIDTSRILGRLEGCSNEVLSTLAAHAVRPSNYGPPRLWSQEDVETVGVVLAGMKPDIISTIPAEAMQGLIPLAVKNLLAPSIIAFTTEQLEKISFSAARAFTPAQFNNLAPTQLQAVQSVLQIQNELFNVPVINEQSDDSHQDVVRNVEKSDVATNETDSIGGRARDPRPDTGDKPEIVIIDDTATEDDTTTPPPDTNSPAEEPKSSAASPAKLLSISSYSVYSSLLAILVSVIQFTHF